MAKSSPSDFPVTIHDMFKENRTAATAISDWGPSLTRQEFAEECDINAIMARYETTGVMPHRPMVEPAYLDLTEMPPDFQSALDLLSQAERSFMTLPAKIRREFDNDPSEFVNFASDPDNIDQLREWGLAKPKERLPDVVREGPPMAGALPAAPAGSPQGDPASKPQK